MVKMHSDSGMLKLTKYIRCEIDCVVGLRDSLAIRDFEFMEVAIMPHDAYSHVHTRIPQIKIL